MPNTVEIIFSGKDTNLMQTIKGIDQGLDHIGKTAPEMGRQVDASLSVFKGNVIADFFQRGASAVVDFSKTSVAAFKELQAAQLGLQSVARFQGISPQDATAAVQNLELVKNGLISVGEASASVKNLLAAGFNLEQSIELVKRLGDSAAFGRQGFLGLGEAVKSATQGIKNGESALVDNAGVTRNLSAILKDAGFQMQDLSDKTKGAAATQALYAGLIKETQAQVGDAAKLANTFAGQLSRVDAATTKLQQTTGEAIATNKELSTGIDLIIKRLQDLTDAGKNSNLKSFFEGIVSNIGLAIQQADSLIDRINQLSKPAERAGVPATGRDLQENFRKQGIPTTGLEILDFLGDARRVVGNLAASITESVGEKLFGTTPERDEVEAFLKRLDDEVKKITTPPTPTADLKIIDQLERLRNAPDPFTQLKFDEDQRVATEKFLADLEKSNAAFAKSISDAESAVTDLQNKLSTNPVGDVFDHASRRVDDFLERFRNVPREIVDGFKRASAEVAQLDLFKGTLSQGLGLNNLLLEQAKLQAGLGGKKTLTQADEARLAELQSGNIDRAIATARTLQERATNDAQRQFANQQILSATSDIRNLTEPQIAARSKALTDEITLGQKAFQENFARLAANTEAHEQNTAALVQVGNRLALVEGALTNFADKPISIVVEEGPASSINLGSVQASQ